MKRYFEFLGADSGNKSGQASKFWEVSLAGTTLSIRFGKIGVNGQTTTKDFPDEDSAQVAANKAISEKLRKGYEEREYSANSEEAHFETRTNKEVTESDQESPANLLREDKGLTLSQAQKVAQIGWPNLCHDCCEEILDGSRFCWNCGVDLGSVETKCAACGVIRIEGAKFCAGCGNSFGELNEQETDLHGSRDESEALKARAARNESLSNWMRTQIAELSGSNKTMRAEFVAGPASQFIFSVEHSPDSVVDICVSVSALDVEEIFSEDFEDFSEEDPRFPGQRRHFFWDAKDFDIHGSELVDDIAASVPGDSWRAIHHQQGLFGPKTRTETWEG